MMNQVVMTEGKILRDIKMKAWAYLHDCLQKRMKLDDVIAYVKMKNNQDHMQRAMIILNNNYSVWQRIFKQLNI